MQYMIAIDQGTTSSRAILVNHQGQICGICQKEYPQIYPQPGWVEHNPMDIWNVQLEVLKNLLESRALEAKDIAGIGITNQRETTIVWDRHTGEPVYNGIVWQCRRTAHICNELKRKNLTEMIQQKTGLIVDAYFSGPKIQWILEHVEGARQRAERGDLLFGTVDTWLIWRLTGGAVHATDYTNASRTMLYNIHRLDWDKDLLQEMGIPPSMMPQVLPTSGIFGMTDPKILGGEISIAAAAGDQQAALFGQMCLQKGMAKNTYGTGCFMLMNTGTQPIDSKCGLLTTIAWGFGNEVTYALEGSIFTAGSLIQWLRDDLRMIRSAEETEEIALSVEGTNGVYVVPAFTGLGTPYWDMYARGAILGLTRAAKREHIIRASLEAIAYQSQEVLKVMEEDAGLTLSELRVDGGAARNNFLLQFQCDILGTKVVRPHCTETTAIGAAFLAGLAVGYWKNRAEIQEIWQEDRIFIPKTSEARRHSMMKGWKKAVERSLEWE